MDANLEAQLEDIAARRMAEMAAHLVEQVIPWVPTRQWVVSVPIPLRYWMAPSRELTARVHTIIRRTIGQYYVNQAVKHGATRATVHPGSVTFLQRFGGSINLNLHFHVIFLEGVYEDRTARGLKPRFRSQEPPTDAEVAAVLHTISRRVIRQLRKLGYLEANTEDVVPTGYDPASDEDPELARTMAASVQQRIAFGERAGQKVVSRIDLAAHWLGLWLRRRTPHLDRHPLCQCATVFRCMPIRWCRRIVGISWNGCCAIRPGGRSPSSAWSAMPTATSSTRSRAPGRMAPRASNSPRWSCWRNWRR